jgi:hypothetical protein
MLNTADLCIRDTGTGKGRGVFALRRFAVGEVVETCPVLVISGRAGALPHELKSFAFDWAGLGGPAKTQGIALGWGSMYNHHNPANMRYEAAPDQALLRFIAVRDIQAQEELTINYNAAGGSACSHDDHWFEHRQLKVLD